MPGHAFVRISGFGWTLLPAIPTRFEQLPGKAPGLRILRCDQGRTHRAVLHFGIGEPRIELAPDTHSLKEVAELVPGPAVESWRIETSLFSHAWPKAFVLESLGSVEPVLYHLDGPEEALIDVQGPFTADKLALMGDFSAPDQKTVRQGKTAGHTWYELAYAHDDRAWRQRQYVVAAWPDGAFVVVSGQAPHTQAPVVASAADEIVSSFVAAPREPV
jgi:hypothetical protein